MKIWAGNSPKGTKEEAVPKKQGVLWKISFCKHGEKTEIARKDFGTEKNKGRIEATAKMRRGGKFQKRVSLIGSLMKE